MKTVLCKYCGALTTMTGTRLCDRCWNLSNSLSGTDPSIAGRIARNVYDARSIRDHFCKPIEKRVDDND